MRSDAPVTFLQWFFPPGLIRVLEAGLGSAAFGWFVLHESRKSAQGGLIFEVLFRNPLFLMGYGLFILSLLDLDFMGSRLRGVYPSNIFKSPFARPRLIPQQYKAAFGPDLYYIYWKLRLIFMLPAAVSMIEALSRVWSLTPSR